jgi:hypothetical protein
MLSRSYVETLVKRHLAGEANLGQQLWALVCFERWLQLLPDWRKRATADPHTRALALS